MLSPFSTPSHFLRFSRRRLWLWSYVSLLGALINLLVLQLPLLAPLLLGNTAFLVLLLRLGPAWGLACFAVVTLPFWGAWLWWLSLAEFCLVFLAWRLGQQKIGHLYLCCWPLLAVAVVLYQLWLGAGIGFALLISGVLALGGVLNLFGSKMILNVAIGKGQSQHQPLAEQLAGRITVFSAVPALVLILAALHAYVIWDLSKRHEQLIRLEQHFLNYSANQLQQFRAAVKQAALSYSRQPDAGVLTDLLAMQPHFISTAIVDAVGDVTDYRIRTGEQLQGPVNVADRAYFEQLKLKPVGSFVSDAYVGRGLGHDLLFAVSAPMLSAQQEFRGIVQASVLLSSLIQQLQPAEASPNMRAVLLDKQDQLIWSVPSSEAYGRSFRIGADLLPGKLVFASSWLSPDGGIQLNQPGRSFIRQHQTDDGWLLLLQYRLDSVLLGYNVLTLMVILLAILALWLLNRSSFYVVRLYTRPLKQLIQSIQRLELQQQAPFCDLSDRVSGLEVQQLFEAYNAMVVRLHQAGSRLEELNSSLEQRVRQRTEELQTERDRATELAEVKSRFLATMSHELRTPLTAIIGYTEQLLRQQKQESSQHDQLQVIARNSRYLLDVVNDILDAAKLEEGKLTMVRQPVALAALLQDLCSDVNKLAKSKKLQLEVVIADDIPAWLLLDPQRVRQILLNLLSNAIKFTEQGKVVLRASRLSAHRLQVEVSDTGIGMSMEQLEKIFSAFEQADSGTSRKYGGTGLGLHISYQLAELMQGELSVSSLLGQGSHFRLELPLVEPEAEQLAKQQSLQPLSWQVPVLQGQVLVVDDVADIRLLVADLLEQSGLTVTQAENGEQATQLAQQQRYDLILMDMNMPVLDGAEATRRLRQVGLQLPILALTADVLPEDKAVFLQAGCNEVLTKPIDPPELYQMVQQYLQGQPQVEAKPDKAQAAIKRIEALKQSYLQQLPAQLQQLQAFVAKQDEAQILGLLHQIKGTAGSFGLAAISQCAARLEQQQKKGQRITAEDCEALAALMQSA
ncbi:MAG: response regulator [Alkalimonas sp.]|nr:response regulator [Alkalimonas sp.]